MIYDYSKLKGRIVEKCGSIKNFAKLMQSSERTISLKLNNKVCFNQKDIEKTQTILDILDEEIQPYFFTRVVQ